MKKILIAVTCVVFLAGCGVGDVTVQTPKPMEGGNNGRIQQYLEEEVMASGTAICNFDMLNQPKGNVVEVWALCEEFELGKLGTEVERGSVVEQAVKITFANPTLHVIGAEGMSAKAMVKIEKGEFDLVALAAKNLARAEKWLLGRE